jgi:hypothetical protein
MSAASKRDLLVSSGLSARRAAVRQADRDPVDALDPPAAENEAAVDTATKPTKVAAKAAAKAGAPRRLAAVDASLAGADTLGHLPAQDGSAASPRVSAALQISPAVVAGLVFAACGVLAAATVQHTLVSFAHEGGVSPVVFLAVPGLFAALFAILVYQGARRKINSMAQSFSRALLVALLTWASFSALATSVWCKPEHYGQCYSSFLIVSGLIGGGPMLLAAGLAGAIVGWWILKQRQ